MPEVVVQQRDIQAAEPFRLGQGGVYDRRISQLAFAFARHRMQAEAAMRDRCAEVAEDYADHYLGGAPEGLAKAIREAGK